MRKSLILLFFLLNICIPQVNAAERVKYSYTLTYAFENRGNSVVNLEDEDLTVPLFINNEHQTVTIIDATYPQREIYIDEDNNKGVIFDAPKELQPDDSYNITVIYEIISSNQKKPDINLEDAQNFDTIPVSLIQEYVVSTETFMMDDPEISNFARNLTEEENTVLGSVVKLIDWITDNTVYCNYEVPQYPSNTFNEGLGDCDDQSILLISMCRSVGIPSYLGVGVIIHTAIGDDDTSWDGHLISIQDGIGWHGWAMIYIPPWGWVPIDLTLTNEDTSLELINSAPEYENYIIECLKISKQPYINSTLETRNRIMNSDLYVTVIDQASKTYSQPFWLNYTVIVMGTLVFVVVFFMFKTGKKDFN